jgi:4-methylaminobutanoate oxidase (formaldehyde-forming)
VKPIGSILSVGKTGSPARRRASGGERERTAIFDQTGFSKFCLPKATTCQRFSSGYAETTVDVPHRQAVYTGTVQRPRRIRERPDGVPHRRTWIFHHHRQFADVRDFDRITRNIRAGERAELVDVTNGYSILGVMGPNSRALLSRVTDTDLSESCVSVSEFQSHQHRSRNRPCGAHHLRRRTGLGTARADGSGGACL